VDNQLWVQGPYPGIKQAENAGVIAAPHHDLLLLARGMDASALGAGGLGVLALQDMRSLVVFPVAAVRLPGPPAPERHRERTMKLSPTGNLSANSHAPGPLLPTFLPQACRAPASARCPATLAQEATQGTPAPRDHQPGYGQPTHLCRHALSISAMTVWPQGPPNLRSHCLQVPPGSCWTTTKLCSPPLRHAHRSSHPPGPRPPL
jgi:hypothetical protein